MTRQDIHILSRNSNWTATGIQQQLNSDVYAHKSAWKNLINYSLLGAGIAFAVAGILFFFAFNWNDLHKFVKLGLIQALIITAVLIAYFYKSLDERIRNSILAGASILVGVLFAVFGQIYQTGADAYDFFSGWTLAIALWALVSGFPVLWFILLILVNTTVIMYANQVAFDWPFAFVLNLLFIINALFLVLIEVLTLRKIIAANTGWLRSVVALFSITIITICVCSAIFGSSDRAASNLSIVLALVAFATALWYGYRHRQLLYLGAVPFAIMVVLVCLFIEPINNPVAAFLVIGIFVVTVTTLLIRQLVKLNKHWHETEL